MKTGKKIKISPEMLEASRRLLEAITKDQSWRVLLEMRDTYNKRKKS